MAIPSQGVCVCTSWAWLEAHPQQGFSRCARGLCETPEATSLEQASLQDQLPFLEDHSIWTPSLVILPLTSDSDTN